MRREIFIGLAVGLSAFFAFTEYASAQSAQVGQLAQTGTASMRPMTYADLERLYLEGKISAKEYQKLLADIKSRPLPAPAPAPAQPVPPQPKPQTPPQKNPSTAVVSPSTNRPAVTAVRTNQQDTISDVEAKMDALIKARQKATNTAPPRTVTAGPKTKRERMNDLLRLYIEGKISETELNERRAKIIAEPD